MRRKARFSSHDLDSGTSGGYRVFYAAFRKYGKVVLVTLFAKSVQANLSRPLRISSPGCSARSRRNSNRSTARKEREPQSGRGNHGPQEDSCRRLLSHRQTSTEPQRDRVKTSDDAREQGLSEVDREIIGGAHGLPRQTPAAAVPWESKYTVRQVVVVEVLLPRLGPEDVTKGTRSWESASPFSRIFSGTPTLHRGGSWEQGQKPPSPMARRLLGLIASDPPYWKSRFCSMVEPRGGEKVRWSRWEFTRARRANDRVVSGRKVRAESWPRRGIRSPPSRVRTSYHEF